MSVSITMHEVYHLIRMDEPHFICVGLDASGHPGAVFGEDYGPERPNEEKEAHIFGLAFGGFAALLFALREFLK